MKMINFADCTVYYCKFGTHVQLHDILYKKIINNACMHASSIVAANHTILKV